MESLTVITTTHYLLVSAVLFAVGVMGVLLRRSAIIVFLSIELMLNAVNLSFVAISRELGSMDGQVAVFFVMTIAAAEVAIGLSLIVAIFRSLGSTDVDDVRQMRG